MHTKLTLGERLKDLRIERGYTLEELAAQTGLSKAALGKYETNEVRRYKPVCHYQTGGFL